MPATLLEKLWNLHEIADLGGRDSLIHIDRIFLHERTGSIALRGLEQEGRNVRAPRRAFCTMDHIVDTRPGRGDISLVPHGREFIEATRHSARNAGIHLFDIDDSRQGIVHVVAAENGIVLPGMSAVCPDSHTCTLGALGALAWGIGSTEAEHALATSCLRASRPHSMRVNFVGTTTPGVTAKDMILHLIAGFGSRAGRGFAVEFAGPAIHALNMDGRFTICNMAVEMGAFTGMIAPDERTIAYVRDAPYAPRGPLAEQAEAHWRELHSDEGAEFDRELEVDCARIAPSVTWGTNPEQLVGINGVVPEPGAFDDPQQSLAARQAQAYMDLEPGTSMRSVRIDAAFIGSCTNNRLDDLRDAANHLRGRKVASWVQALCVPGSSAIKRQAEAEGLDEIFQAAGFEWREAGCSLCFHAGGESFGGRRVISSTNRNFQGRQGPGARTHLASPLTVAASACRGYISTAEDS
ncbi:MAG: 3-isopropylmalate dehydratase large subunit [Gammaproteobacteria bacterium]|nr:3-isopropylmalate dehydratase large subunit [Gammaproteobacteria bacterium]MYH86845.1 3-isopropylmalate dehydratase large subunit [Gammaproteobacteria bacterium]MYK04972.1 3-isopropylmalate dehydratase large subunit [Gammaproteobacteria bacterium]